MPKGMYVRKKETVPATTVASAEPENGENKKAAEDVKHRVDEIVRDIRNRHERIASTVLDIGQRFFDIKKVLDAAPVGSRKYGVKSFTAWMNTEASTLSNMSARTAWNYYREYSASIAAGLSEKTITALAPTLLRQERPRKLMLAAIQRTPELAAQLNEAANNPRQIKAIAQSQPIQKILERAQALPTPELLRDKVKRTIINAMKPVFPAKRENFDLTAANNAIADVVYAIRGAAHDLRISAFIPVGYVKMTDKDVDALYKEGAQAVPAQQDLVSAVSASVTKAVAAAAA